jgi:hypothetical protein
MVEKTLEEVKHEQDRIDEMKAGPVVMYKVDVKKLEAYGYQGIADKLNALFGPIAIDASDDGTIEKMFLDSDLGDLVSRDEEKVDILP